MNRFQAQRLFANLVLAFLFLLFVASVPHRHEPGIGRLAFFVLEAALVAGCADWFAVTALLRHPFGLKISHTAIVPLKHAQIGKGLAALIRTKFLRIEDLRERVASMNPTLMILDYVETANPSGLAELITKRLSQFKNTEDIANKAQSLLIGLLSQAKAARYLGQLLQEQINHRRLEPAFDLLLAQLEMLIASPTFESSLANQLKKFKDSKIEELNGVQRLVAWVANVFGGLDERSAARDIIKATKNQIHLALDDQNHPLRQGLHAWAQSLAKDLIRNTDISSAVDQWWAELVSTIDLKTPAQDLLHHILAPATLQKLQPSLERAISGSINALRQNGSVAEILDHRVRALLTESLPLLYEVLEPFVDYVFSEQLTKDKMVDFVESEVGDVLQQLRIMGTFVGGVIGLLLALLTQSLHA